VERASFEMQWISLRAHAINTIGAQRPEVLSGLRAGIGSELNDDPSKVRPTDCYIEEDLGVID
jgi:hypothetical protein